MHTRDNGFSMIEIIITLVVLSLLTMLAMPSFSQWIDNVRVRTMAESIQNGIRLTQIEAAKRNAPVTFRLTPVDDPTCATAAITTATDESASWIICDQNSATIQLYSRRGGNAVLINSGFNTVTFDGLGRPIDNTGNIDIKKSGKICEQSGGNVRCLRVTLSSGGKVKMCDPKLDAGHPAACS